MQIEESYGKIVYSYTVHLKCADLLRRKNNILKWILIIFSAVSTCGLLGVILQWNTTVLSIVTAFFTTLSLVFSTYSKSANLENQILAHRETANQLWRIREEYLSLLTDFSNLTEINICEKRDELMNRTANIYEREPFTDSRSYKKAQIALKNKEEQYFSTEELNKMLPEHLRIKK